jgi:hypothetical protein
MHSGNEEKSLGGRTAGSMGDGRRFTGAYCAGERHEPLRGGGPRECEYR